MFRAHLLRFGAVRGALLLIGLLAITTLPAFAQSGAWTKTGNMKTAREPGAILLPNGQVLVAGGDGSNGLLASAELYNPVTGQWRATGSMNTAGGGAMTVLQNRQVLSNGADVELYNPSSGTWTVTASMNTARFGFTQTLLPNGRCSWLAGKRKTVSALRAQFSPMSSCTTHLPPRGQQSAA